jgi:predicted dehydrogenase
MLGDKIVKAHAIRRRGVPTWGVFFRYGATTYETNFNLMQYNQQLDLTPSPVSRLVKAHLGNHAPKVGDAETEAWLDAVINDTEPYVKPEQAHVVTQILEAVYKSAATGGAIELA